MKTATKKRLSYIFLKHYVFLISTLYRWFGRNTDLTSSLLALTQHICEECFGNCLPDSIQYISEKKHHSKAKTISNMIRKEPTFVLYIDILPLCIQKGFRCISTLIWARNKLDENYRAEWYYYKICALLNVFICVVFERHIIGFL